jgi:hypothetical protein
MLIDLLPIKVRRKLWRNDLGIFIRENSYSSGLELGVKGGRSLKAILKINPSLRITGIDLWKDMPESSPYKKNSKNELVAQKIIRNYKNASLLKGDCLFLAGRIPDNSLDFVFYDLYDYRWSNVDFVKSVFEAYLPKLRSSGMFIGRDFDQPDFKQACKLLNLTDPKQCLISNTPNPRLKYILP